MRRMLETPPEDDRPFWMINLIKYREKADYADGRETDLTGREADALYEPLEFLEAIGAIVVFVGEVDDTLISSDGVEWEQIAIVRYPSRAKFFELVQNEEFQARAIHKDAGVEKSLVIVSELEEVPEAPEPSMIPNPATPSDPPTLITHLLRYHDVAQYPPGSDEPERSGREAMALYESAATGVALEQGGAPLARFAIEGVYVGDGRVWDEFRINLFPSRTAFDVVVADPTRQEGQFHRMAALEDTYSTAGTSIIINRLSQGDAGASDGGVLEVTDNGTGTLCATNADCAALTANRCVGADGAGFCSVEGCSAGTCEGSYVCCRDCADFAADLLPFEGSACVPAALSSQLTDAPACTCD
ncbi:MAG: hypothetical protein AAF436_03420 [Myxococcota bacterium]